MGCSHCDAAGPQSLPKICPSGGSLDMVSHVLHWCWPVRCRRTWALVCSQAVRTAKAFQIQHCCPRNTWRLFLLPPASDAGCMGAGWMFEWCAFPLSSPSLPPPCMHKLIHQGWQGEWHAQLISGLAKHWASNDAQAVPPMSRAAFWLGLAAMACPQAWPWDPACVLWGCSEKVHWPPGRSIGLQPS